MVVELKVRKNSNGRETSRGEKVDMVLAAMTWRVTDSQTRMIAMRVVERMVRCVMV